AIERLSSDLRAGIGKSLGSIQATDQRHWSWTTSSLPAFQRALAATRSRSSGDYLRAIELDKEATALDPDFANAYVAIASNVQYAGLPRGGGVPGIERAYRLRDSLNARERWVVEAYYHRDVTGDWTKAIAAFQEHFTALKQIGETGFTADVAAALELDGELAAADQVIQDGNVFIGPQNPGNQLTHVPVLHA